MKIFFDHDIPVQLRKHLQGHLVSIASKLGWERLANGELIRVAESAGYEVLVTGDQRIFYQQNNLTRKIALVVLSRTDRNGLEPFVEQIRSALDRAVPGSYERVELPKRQRKQRP